MVALAIGGVVLGLSAPLISNNIQGQNFSDAQLKLIMSRLEKLEQSQVPKGTVAFFSNSVMSQSTNPCPKGWSQAPSDWGGRFFKVAEVSTPADVKGGKNQVLQEQSIQEHWHDLPAFNLTGMTGAEFQTAGSHAVWLSPDDYFGTVHLAKVAQRDPLNAFAGKVFRKSDAFKGKSKDAFPDVAENLMDAPAVLNDNETRPKNIALLVCIKD